MTGTPAPGTPNRPRGLRFEPYAVGLSAEIAAFNERLRQGGWRIFGLEELEAPPADAAISEAQYVVVDVDGRVRGGLNLVHEPLWIAGAEADGANLQSPIAEGVVDERFATVAPFMLKKAVRQARSMYAVGMGGLDRPLARLLAALGWRVEEVPFFFRVHRSSAFLRELPLLRATRGRRLAALAARWTGLGPLLLPWSFRRRGRTRAVEARIVDAWGAWAGELWDEARERIDFATCRTPATLPLLYPPGDRIRILRATRDGRAVGWLAVVLTPMRDSPHFGNLVVGTILDGVAVPGFEAGLLRAGDDHLREGGADIVISNQLHPAWIEGLEQAGFRRGPSNYVFACSPSIRKALDALERPAALHVNRGDGDGRIHV